MDKTELRRRLAELLTAMATLPASDQEKLELLAAKSKNQSLHQQSKANAVQEGLDFLRVAVKYLLFDLEATRRENSFLRWLLQQQQDNC